MIGTAKRDWREADKQHLAQVRESLAAAIEVPQNDLRLMRFRRRASLEVSGHFYQTPKGRSEEPTGFTVTLVNDSKRVQFDLWDLVAIAATKGDQ